MPKYIYVAKHFGYGEMKVVIEALTVQEVVARGRVQFREYFGELPEESQTRMIQEGEQVNEYTIEKDRLIT